MERYNPTDNIVYKYVLSHDPAAEKSSQVLKCLEGPPVPRNKLEEILLEADFFSSIME